MKPKWERGKLNIDIYWMCLWKETIKWDSKPDRKFCKGSKANSRGTQVSQDQTPKTYTIVIMYSHGKQRFILRKMSSATLNECS